MKVELSLDGWNAYPLVGILRPIHDDISAILPICQGRRLQTNSYDCGAWVLACAAAILRGYGSVDMPETQITEFRRWLLAQALSLPATKRC